MFTPCIKYLLFYGIPQSIRQDKDVLRDLMEENQEEEEKGYVFCIFVALDCF